MTDDKTQTLSLELSGYQFQPEIQGLLALQAHVRWDRVDENPWELELQRRQASENIKAKNFWCFGSPASSCLLPKGSGDEESRRTCWLR